ncbi:uncharacterized protein LOC9657751 [Selaginella moellendorffii]|uniref:uncharacterized protein LOC9657751 n=1 Tax=Selaginella moellendorffii TaxID=88036 RepID=UPI000D1C31C8|nr:uncharacterized protein LOC9657751 [Selaginella moellendorffii]XP_024517690.1 uncharacterized protein LOC9657751 [Selaginella moellendorffii]XP_024517691.1 uncharacterized protein LOC9657751 [Selaginella moellendorffii]|eukprot:XP_024517689.1 uncharacterized protein LOC9657751 [Selaginella moellendorffii]
MMLLEPLFEQYYAPGEAASPSQEAANVWLDKREEILFPLLVRKHCSREHQESYWSYQVEGHQRFTIFDARHAVAQGNKGEGVLFQPRKKQDGEATQRSRQTKHLFGEAPDNILVHCNRPGFP